MKKGVFNFVCDLKCNTIKYNNIEMYYYNNKYRI